MATPTNPHSAPKTLKPPTQQRRAQTKVKHGGGFHPSAHLGLNINVSKGGTAPGPGAQAGAQAGAGKGTPGGDFMSNEDIRAYSEHLRRQARERAVERAMDAEALEAVLRHIPDSTGSMAGARLRARRVSRWIKRIAKAEQLIARWSAALYAQFEREFEANLRKVGRARVQQPRAPFTWR